MTETNAYGPRNSGDDYLAQAEQRRAVRARSSSCASPTRRQRAAAGEVGEIWFRGPNLIRGYWNKPEATAETIVDGWLRTGDLGRIDDEGFVYVRTARRTWCCAAARTCTAPRSRRRSTNIRACTRRRSSACRTSGSARRSRAS